MNGMMQRTGWLPVPTTFADAMDMAEQLSSSELAPPAYHGKPLAIVLIADFAHRIGIPFLTALQGVAVISGKPTLWGDCMLAVAQSHPSWRGMAERMEGTGDDLRAICTVRRDSRDDCVAEFSTAMAKRARLWGKPGPWSFYPARMLQMRARSWALRAAFADALQGIESAEEISDVELAEGRPAPQRDGTVINATPTFAQAPPVAEAARPKRRGRPPTGRPPGRPRKQPVVIEGAIPEASAPLPGQHALPHDMAPGGQPPGWAERIASARTADELVEVGRMVAEARLPDAEQARLRDAYGARQRQLVPPMPAAAAAPGDADGMAALRRRAAERGG